MANIPDISFKSSEDATDIEFLNLSELFLKLISIQAKNFWFSALILWPYSCFQFILNIKSELETRPE